MKFDLIIGKEITPLLCVGLVTNTQISLLMTTPTESNI